PARPPAVLYAVPGALHCCLGVVWLCPFPGDDDRGARAARHRWGEPNPAVPGHPARGLPRGRVGHGHGPLHDGGRGGAGHGTSPGGMAHRPLWLALDFFINVPVGLVGIAMAATVLADPPHVRRTLARIDLVGIALLTLSLTTMQLVL